MFANGSEVPVMVREVLVLDSTEFKVSDGGVWSRVRVNTVLHADSLPAASTAVTQTCCGYSPACRPSRSPGTCESVNPFGSVIFFPEMSVAYTGELGLSVHTY